VTRIDEHGGVRAEMALVDEIDSIVSTHARARASLATTLNSSE
jgi:hypothetical protein